MYILGQQKWFKPIFLTKVSTIFKMLNLKIKSIFIIIIFTKNAVTNKMLPPLKEIYLHFFTCSTTLFSAHIY